GVQLVNWKQTLEKKWANLRFGDVKVETAEGQHVFSVQVYLDGLDPDNIRVELYADGMDGGEPVTQPMIPGQQLVGAENGYIYTARVPAARPAADYTARIIPYHPCVAV